MSTPKATPLTDELREQYRGADLACFGRALIAHSNTLERALTAARAERDLAITRVASILWSGAIDKHTAGDVQQWVTDYTAELARLRAENDRLRYDRLTLEGVTEMWKQEKARAERAEAEILERAAMMREVMRERDALAKDKAWLDWMLKNVGKHYAPMCHDRAAIDAAMKASEV